MSTKSVTFICFIVFALSAYAQPTLRKDNIADVLAAMTLEEKATLLVGGSVRALINGIPTGLEAEVPGASGNTRPIERLGIPSTILADGPAGVRISPARPGSEKTYYATGFPVGTLLACSWDTSLVQEVTGALGNEVLEYGVDVLLAPGMNIQRNPLCGRNFEYFSEDPLLSGKMGAAYINGIQSNGVGVSVKHFAANNQETNRNETDARVSQRALREIYLKNFEIAVKESHPWTVMSSYNRLNGQYTQQHKGLMTSVLRDEWGFDGIVMTDWGLKDGTPAAVIAGNDLMEPGDQKEIDRIVEAVNRGVISREELDRNVRRMLEYIVKTPHFSHYAYSNAPDLSTHAAIARKGAAESIVLLKNEGCTLPLSGKEEVALFGISSVDFVAGGTGSGDVNKAYVINMKQGLEQAGFSVDGELAAYYDSYKAYKEAERSLKASADLAYKLKLWFSGEKLEEISIPDRVIEDKSRTCDVAMIVLGRNAGEGTDRRLEGDFELTPVEYELIEKVSNAFHARDKKVVVILNIGGVIETASWKNRVDAILLPWSPGQEGANAVADILAGKVNPSGKLTQTFPNAYFDTPSARNFPYDYDNDQTRQSLSALLGKGGEKRNVDYTDYEEDIWVGYRYYTSRNIPVSFPFGFGLSYTTFHYSDPKVKQTREGLEASVRITNTGDNTGREVVQLYVTAPEGGLAKPARELKAFAKTRNLAPGESQVLSFQLNHYDLASFNEATSAWETAPGTYHILFGASVEDIRESLPIKLNKWNKYAVDSHIQL